MYRRFVFSVAFGLILIFLSAFVFTRHSYASEGTAELRSTNENSYRCFVASIQMVNLNYRILVSCRDLLYPAGDDIFTYMLWGTPSAGGRAVKLGELGLGRAEFETKVPFSNLFVTTEKSKKDREPVGPVVMRGDLRRIAFLDSQISPTPTEAAEEDITTPAPELTTKDRLVSGVKRAGVVAALALVAVFGLVFVLTRPR